VKTQIIQLDAHDDCLSVCDKLSWSHAERLLLIWPACGSVLDRLLDLKLVYRHANELGSQLGLVTNDPKMHFYAREIGIPVFDDLRKAKQEDWNINPHPNLVIQPNNITVDLNSMRSYAHPRASAWAISPITRLLSLCISMVALLALGIVILPSAKITLTPKVELQSIQLDLIADPSSNSANHSSGVLPTYRQEMIIEGRDTFTTTGLTGIPDEYALGELNFTNNSTQTVTIPIGTIVTTNESVPVRFITTSSSNVIVGANKTVSVPARAVKPGVSGNLPANSLLVIENSPGLALSVSNLSATRGGTNANVPSPSTYDLQTLRQRLESKLEQDALTQMQSYLPEGDQLILPTIALLETIEETQLPSITEPGDQLELFLRVKFQCQVISLGMLRNMLSKVLDERLPEGYSALPGTLVIAPLNEASQGKDGLFHYSITAKRELKADIPPSQIIGKLTGLTVAKAKDHLSATLPLASQADIKLAPSWWPRLPFTAMRIDLVFAENP
jgi:hypothetical protein